MKVERNRPAPLTVMSTLILSALAVSVTATDPPNFTGHWVLNTKDSDDLAEGIGQATATTSWQDRTLVVTWKTGPDNMSRIRHYTLAEDRQQLTMTERGPRGTLPGIRPQPGPNS